jgi:hypothetical protein
MFKYALAYSTSISIFILVGLAELIHFNQFLKDSKGYQGLAK